MNKDEALPNEWLRFAAGQRLTNQKIKSLAVAVSGGSDSLACLDLMRSNVEAYGFHLEAVTVDHGLRKEAKDEIALVRSYCETHQIPHTVLGWSWDGQGNLMAAARDGRYRVIAEWAKKNRIGMVALGHTQNDVAETFLMRLARQSGLDGLAAMETEFERFGVSWLRPLWQVKREDLREYLRGQGISWADDPTNEDEQFDRVKARKLLDMLAPFGIEVDTLGTVAHNLWTAKSALDHYLHDLAWRSVKQDRGDLILPVDMVEDDRTIPHETQYKLRAQALRWVGGGAYTPRSDGMIEMEIALKERSTHTLGGCLITRQGAKPVKNWQWRVSREYNAVKALATPTEQLWDGRWQLDGDHEKMLKIRALGEAVKDTPWRETGMPRASLMASPAIWRGDALIAAPVAGLSNGWTAEATGRGKFTDFLLSR